MRDVPIEIELVRFLLRESPKSTLDFLAMVACQENLNLYKAEDYRWEALLLRQLLTYHSMSHRIVFTCAANHSNP